MSQKKTFGEKKPAISVKNKKISFFAAILLVIGSSIGAGTFIKNKEVLLNTGNSIVLLIISWVISIIAVVCMGISLIEVTSGAPADNGSFVSWNKTFNKRIVFKMSKNFVAYLYLPLSFFLMPLYAVMMFQDAFGWQTSWWVAALIGFAFSMWFIILSGLSSKAGNIQNQILSYLKFIPLLFAAIIGFVCVGMGCSQVGQEGYPSWLPDTWGQQSGRQLLGSMFPVLGLVSSIPAILFAYDGFYTAAGIQTEMQHPEKTGSAISIGLLFVSVANIIISISLCLCSKDGKLGSIVFNGIGDTGNKALHIVVGVMEIIVALGILGILNSMALWAPRFYEYLIKTDDLWVPAQYRTKLNDHCPKVGVVYTIIISTLFFVVCIFVGAFGYLDVNQYSTSELTTITGDATLTGYDGDGTTRLAQLYSFTDLMGNWTSVFAFAFIIVAMIGGIINRKTNNVKVKQVKGFYPCSNIAVIIIGIGLLFVVVSSIANIPIVAGWQSQIGTGDYDYEHWRSDMIGVSLTLVLLFAYALITIIPSVVAVHNEKTPTRGTSKKETKKPELAKSKPKSKYNKANKFVYNYCY